MNFAYVLETWLCSVEVVIFSWRSSFLSNTHRESGESSRVPYEKGCVVVGLTGNSIENLSFTLLKYIILFEVFCLEITYMYILKQLVLWLLGIQEYPTNIKSCLSHFIVKFWNQILKYHTPEQSTRIKYIKKASTYAH